MDIHNKKTRSLNMQMIRSKDTKPEMTVRKFLFQNGYRYILHDKRLPGKPDIVLPKYKTVINVNGCFWHMHQSCKYFSVPKTKTEWWLEKLQGNRSRDALNYQLLKERGWKVITFWECCLKEGRSDENLSLLIASINE